jgi:hypothetical protein
MMMMKMPGNVLRRWRWMMMMDDDDGEKKMAYEWR